MPRVDGLELAAYSARLPPLVAAQLAPGMNALVLGGTDEPQVFEAVVLLVIVDVMDLVSSGHASVNAFPSGNVSELESAVDEPAQVSLAGDV